MTAPSRLEILKAKRERWETFAYNALCALGGCVVVITVWQQFFPTRPDSAGYWALWFFGAALPSGVFAASGTMFIWTGFLLDAAERRARSVR